MNFEFKRNDLFFDVMICVEPAAAAWAHLESEHGCSANTPTLQRWKGNTDIWQKYWQSWQKYRCLTEILTSWRKHTCLTEILIKLTEIQIFDINTDKVAGNTDIWQKRWQSWWNADICPKKWQSWREYRYLIKIMTKLTDIPIELHKKMLTRMVKIKLIIKRIIFILNKFYKVPYTKLKADKNKMLNGQDCWRLILRSSLHFLSLRSSRAMQLFPPFHNQDSKTTIWAALFCHLSFFHFRSQQPYFPRWYCHNLMKYLGAGTQDISFIRITHRHDFFPNK